MSVYIYISVSVCVDSLSLSRSLSSLFYLLLGMQYFLVCTPVQPHVGLVCACFFLAGARNALASAFAVVHASTYIPEAEGLFAT